MVVVLWSFHDVAILLVFSAVRKKGCTRVCLNFLNVSQLDDPTPLLLLDYRLRKPQNSNVLLSLFFDF